MSVSRTFWGRARSPRVGGPFLSHSSTVPVYRGTSSGLRWAEGPSQSTRVGYHPTRTLPGPGDRTVYSDEILLHTDSRTGSRRSSSCSTTDCRRISTTGRTGRDTFSNFVRTVRHCSGNGGRDRGSSRSVFRVAWTPGPERWRKALPVGRPVVRSSLSAVGLSLGSKP